MLTVQATIISPFPVLRLGHTQPPALRAGSNHTSFRATGRSSPSESRRVGLVAPSRPALFTHFAGAQLQRRFPPFNLSRVPTPAFVWGALARTAPAPGPTGQSGRAKVGCALLGAVSARRLAWRGLRWAYGFQGRGNTATAPSFFSDYRPAPTRAGRLFLEVNDATFHAKAKPADETQSWWNGS